MGRIDTDTLRANTDLLTLAGRDTRLKRVGAWHIGPCPFCGGHDRFNVKPDRWYCRGCGGDKYHDALDYVARRERLDLRRDFRRACALLGTAEALPVRPRPPAPAPIPERSGPPPAEWQSQARAVLSECESALWGEHGERARAWLHGRGLSDDTLRRWRVGYVPGKYDEWRTMGRLSVPCGVVIPCEIAGAIWYVKVRRAVGEPKYIHVKGSRPALFGAETFAGHDVAVLCEGEFDAMLLAQEAGDLAGVATMGSATASLDLTAWGAYLLPVARLLIAYDADDAGRNGAQRLAELTARARRVRLPRVRPGDKDITDFHRAGGKLRDWLAFELARLDLSWHGAQGMGSNRPSAFRRRGWGASRIGSMGSNPTGPHGEQSAPPHGERPQVDAGEHGEQAG